MADSGRLEADNLREIEMLNQRGGRMLSIADLVHAGTITYEAAGYCLWRIARGASFLTGAVPGGAGKTTLLADLLGMLPPGERIVTTPDPGAVREALAEPDRTGRCYLCHEIGSGTWYGYLWGETVGRFFGLMGNGGRVAACLHADDPVQMRNILLTPTLGVSAELFDRVELLAFMAVEHRSGRTVRRVSSIWTADDRGGHELSFELDAASDRLRRVRPARAEGGGRPTLAECEALMTGLAEGRVRLFEDVRRALVMSVFA
jgi:hypothetical protein